MLLTLLALVLSHGASATVPDLYGPGARWSGMGGGGAAAIDDAAAPILNPAALSSIAKPQVALSFSHAADQFTPLPAVWWDTNRDGLLNSQDDPLVPPSDVPNANGIHFAFARPVGQRFGVGVAGYLPTQYLIRIDTIEPSIPSYLQYQNRTQRYTLAVGAAVEMTPGLRIGLSADLVPRAQVDVALGVNANLDGSKVQSAGIENLLSGVIDVHQVRLDLRSGVVPVIGAQCDVGQWVTPLRGLSVAGTYRGAGGLPVDVQMDIQANLSASNLGSLAPVVLPIILDAQLRLLDHYVPPMLVLGTSWKSSAFLIYADVRRENWTAALPAIAQATTIQVTAPLLELPDDALIDGNPYAATFRATWGARAGTEFNFAHFKGPTSSKGVTLRGRAGFAYAPTPLLQQSEASAMLDSDRFAVSAGIGAVFKREFPIRADLFVQHHRLGSATVPRTAGAPAPGVPIDASGFPVGGSITVFGAQVGFDYL